MDLTTLLSGWINKIEIENPPPADIAAINFGIFESDKGFMIYLTGSEVYDADDDDWAGEIDYQPSRQNKYLLMTGEVVAGLKWKKVLELVTNTLKQLVEIEPERMLFNNRAITLGFDDSELTLIKSR